MAKGFKSTMYNDTSNDQKVNDEIIQDILSKYPELLSAVLTQEGDGIELKAGDQEYLRKALDEMGAMSDEYDLSDCIEEYDDGEEDGECEKISSSEDNEEISDEITEPIFEKWDKERNFEDAVSELKSAGFNNAEALDLVQRWEDGNPKEEEIELPPKDQAIIDGINPDTGKPNEEPDSEEISDDELETMVDVIKSLPEERRKSFLKFMQCEIGDGDITDLAEPTAEAPKGSFPKLDKIGTTEAIQGNALAKLIGSLKF